jgi:hypothetical protein
MILIPAVFCPRPWGSHVRYAYARSLKFYDTTLLWQWMRMPGDVPGHVSACCIGVPDASVPEQRFVFVILSFSVCRAGDF